MAPWHLTNPCINPDHFTSSDFYLHSRPAFSLVSNRPPTWTLKKLPKEHSDGHKNAEEEEEEVKKGDSDDKSHISTKQGIDTQQSYTKHFMYMVLLLPKITLRQS